MDEAAPQINSATGEVLDVIMPSGSYRTYIMQYRVVDSFSGVVRAEADGLTLHAWLQQATEEEMAYVGAGVVERIALYAAGVR